MFGYSVCIGARLHPTPARFSKAAKALGADPFFLHETKEYLESFVET